MKEIKAVSSLAEKYPRLGYRMLHDMYCNGGGHMNHKRFYRIYTQENLALRRRKRKKIERDPIPLTLPDAPGKSWSMDFIFDRTEDGRKLKMFVVVDDFSKESLWIETATAISGSHVALILDNLCLVHGKPLAVRSDNGPEFTSHAMVKWSLQSGVRLNYIQPGKPTQNAYCESFNSRFRHECLNGNLFFDLENARQKVEEWRDFYNNVRPHSSLGGIPPREYIINLEKNSHS
jgi:putative transposase